MALDPELLALMTIHTITREPYTGQDGFGAPTYGAAETVKGKWEAVTKQVRTPSGDEATSGDRIFFPGDPGINYDDRLTLPDGRQPPIMSISKLSADDPDVHHTLVSM
jgi:hypothetical protein